MKTVKQVSKICGVSVRTIQYYDKIHLLKPSAKSAAGYRLYSDADVTKLQQILFLKELDFRLKDIRVLLSNSRLSKASAFRRQKELLCAKRQHLDYLISVLEQLECNQTTDDYTKYLKSLKTHKKELNSMNHFSKILPIIISLSIIAGGGWIIYKAQSSNDNTHTPPAVFSEPIFYINSVSQPSAARIDAEVRVIDITEVPNEFAIVHQLAIPTDIEQSSVYAYYTRADQTTSSYDKFANYCIQYGQPSRSIVISFAKEHAPLRDYHFSDGKTTNIKGQNLTIYEYDGTYFVEFMQDEIFFDIETTGISGTEIITLLTSFFR